MAQELLRRHAGPSGRDRRALADLCSLRPRSQRAKPAHGRRREPLRPRDRSPHDESGAAFLRQVDRPYPSRVSGGLSGRRRGGSPVHLRVPDGDAGGGLPRLSRLDPVCGPPVSRVGPCGRRIIPALTGGSPLRRTAPPRRARFRCRAIDVRGRAKIRPLVIPMKSAGLKSNLPARLAPRRPSPAPDDQAAGKPAPPSHLAQNFARLSDFRALRPPLRRANRPESSSRPGPCLGDRTFVRLRRASAAVRPGPAATSPADTRPSRRAPPPEPDAIGPSPTNAQTFDFRI